MLNINTKKLAIVFNTALAGIAVCLVMTIVTAIHQKKVEDEPKPLTIPTPALLPQGH